MDNQRLNLFPGKRFRHLFGSKSQIKQKNPRNTVQRENCQNKDLTAKILIRKRVRRAKAY